MKHIRKILVAASLFVMTVAFGATLNLSWTDNANNETTQEIERSLENGPFVLLATVGPDVEAYTDNLAVLGLMHTYRVRAINSAWSNEASSTIPSQPGGPSDLTIRDKTRLVNISGRGQVGIDANILIGGFVIQGDTPLPVLIRAIGPTLGDSRFNVPGVLADPQIVLFRSPQTEIARNDNWDGDPAIREAAQSVFAFNLPDDSADAALLVELEPANTRFTLAV
jgi:hypothetical protein